MPREHRKKDSTNVNEILCRVDGKSNRIRPKVRLANRSRRVTAEANELKGDGENVNESANQEMGKGETEGHTRTRLFALRRCVVLASCDSLVLPPSGELRIRVLHFVVALRITPQRSCKGLSFDSSGGKVTVGVTRKRRDVGGKNKLAPSIPGDEICEN